MGNRHNIMAKNQGLGLDSRKDFELFAGYCNLAL
jgi:hypothetical protein